jgi:hypothetical protein
MCSWCKSPIIGHPKRFDYMVYLGGSRGYQPEYHFDFCDECFKKIRKTIKENEMKVRRVKKTAYWRQ